MSIHFKLVVFGVPGAVFCYPFLEIDGRKKSTTGMTLPNHDKKNVSTEILHLILYSISALQKRSEFSHTKTLHKKLSIWCPSSNFPMNLTKHWNFASDKLIQTSWGGVASLHWRVHANVSRYEVSHVNETTPPKKNGWIANRWQKGTPWFIEGTKWIIWINH